MSSNKTKITQRGFQFAFIIFEWSQKNRQK